VYNVETDPAAQEQVAALPAHALAAYAELRIVLETSPWSGAPYNRDNPKGALRVHTFGGGRGLAGVAVVLAENRADMADQR